MVLDIVKREEQKPKNHVWSPKIIYDDDDEIEFSPQFKKDLREARQKYLIDKAQNEKEEIDTDKDEDKAVGTVQVEGFKGADGGTFVHVTKNMARKVYDPNKGYEHHTYNRAPIKKEIQIPTQIPISIIDKDKDKDIAIDKDIDIDKDKDKDIDIDKDKDKDKEEEYMADGYSPYPTREELLRDKLELMRKEHDEKMSMQKKDIDKEFNIIKKTDEDIKKDIQSLDKKICIGEECEKRNEDILYQLKKRIEMLERPSFICRNCGMGIIREGDPRCNACGTEVVEWPQNQMEMVVPV